MRLIHSAGIVVYKYDALTNERLYILLQYQRGYWDFAKGKLEPGETVLEAAVREVKEETNLDVDIHPGFEETLDYTFRERNGMVHKFVTFFVGEALSDNVVMSWEHINFLWLPYQAALDQLNFDNAKDTLKKAELFLENYKK